MDTAVTEEIWRKAPGFDDRYEFSSFGRVRGVKGGIRKLKKNKAGYMILGVAAGGGRSKDAVRAIRFLSHRAGIDRELADIYGGARETIRDIRKGEGWRGVDAG